MSAATACLQTRGSPYTDIFNDTVFLQVRQYLPDDQRIFNAGNHPGPATAGLARFHIDIEYPLEPLRPRHGHMTRNRCLLVWLIGYPWLAPSTPLRRCDQRTMLAVGCDKIAGSDLEQPKAGPKGVGQDARSNMP